MFWPSTPLPRLLHISEVPFMGPIGCVRVGRVNGAFVINPTHAQRKESDLDLIYAGTRERFLMMEGGAAEISEEDFLAAMKFAHVEVVKIVDAQHELRKLIGKAAEGRRRQSARRRQDRVPLCEWRGEALRKALLIADKTGTRQDAVKAIKEDRCRRRRWRSGPKRSPPLPS